MADRSDLAAVLDDVSAFVRRYVVLDEAQLIATTLWTFHTHGFGAASATPYLSITSAEKESGKTRLLEVLELIVARPWFTGRVTAAVLPRKIEQETPTLLLDESDAAFKGEKEYAEALRGVLNSGHRRSGVTTLCVGQGAAISYKNFSTFCPKAIAGIGELPDTVASRSIPVRLKRRAPAERVEDFFLEEAESRAEPLRQAMESLAAHHLETLKHSRPERLAGLRDRAFDSWRPLLAIADLAGGSWPERARGAALELAGRAVEDDDSLGVRLLADCAAAFASDDRLSTEQLIDRLCEDEEAPWPTWHKAARITPRALARLLRPFAIRSKSIRLADGSTPKGYARQDFEDAWRRYPPAHTPDLSATTPQPASALEKPGDSIRNAPPSVADAKRVPNPHEQKDVADVADTNGVRAALSA